MFLMAKGCMRLPKNRRFVDCEIDSVCFNASLPSVAETLAPQVLNKDSDTKGRAEVVAAVQMYVYSMGRIQAMVKRVMWNTLAGMPSIQAFLN